MNGPKSWNCLSLGSTYCGWLQDAGVFPIVPAAVLRQTPLQHAVALMPLAEVASAHRNGGLKLPEGAGRLAITVNGTETDDDLACLKVWQPLTQGMGRRGGGGGGGSPSKATWHQDPETEDDLPTQGMRGGGGGGGGAHLAKQHGIKTLRQTMTSPA